jgi:hypothetical protein
VNVKVVVVREDCVAVVAVEVVVEVVIVELLVVVVVVVAVILTGTTKPAEAKSPVDAVTVTNESP